jgi:phosphoribosyl 1,2-cyclic phosphodiesterase
MEISVIASGSNGNCCLVEDKGTAVLVDAGKSGREIAKRMDFLGKNIEDVKAVLITHKHSDHTRGAGVLSRRFKIPVYMTKKTSTTTMLGAVDEKIFEIGKEFRIGNMSIKAITTSHNVPSCGFVFSKKFGIMTDTGTVTKQMENAIKKIKCVLLESNHDIDLVIKGPYPYFLKQWILSKEGHLSNIDASSLLQKHAKNINLAILGHLSGNNNTPALAMKTFEALVRKKMDVAVANRDRATGVFEI